ncbi:hypothetical protein [Rhizobium leguminosarum]|uniref:hypothetical protein n=1 Tax=Rhizobium leguminosarum TaxID=384 RepID=UPI001FEDD022|nr:hypothetical protein [Rhizobium leguminosarum]
MSFVLEGIRDGTCEDIWLLLFVEAGLPKPQTAEAGGPRATQTEQKRVRLSPKPSTANSADCFRGTVKSTGFGIDGSDNEGPERASAKRGLQRFFTWREDNPGLLEAYPALTFLSPKGFFKVIFQPDFLSELDGRRTAVHVWNTQQELSSNLVLAALCAVAIRFPPQHRPDDFAALSLQDGRFYRWSDATREHAALGENLLAMLDTQCELARTELGIPAIGPEVPLPIA